MRVSNWEERLADAIEAQRSEPFAWGAHDCCRFAARCVDAITGGDYLDRLSEKYVDEPSAKAYIAECGGVRPAVTAFLGEARDGWAIACRGDVCLVPSELGEGLGICTGHRIAVVNELGFSFYSLDRALAVWRID